MGAWNYGIFDDDTAYDFFDEIEADPLQFFQQSAQDALAADYVEYELGHAVLVSGAYLDNLLNGTEYRNDNENSEEIDNVNNFKSLKPDLMPTGILREVIRAMRKVMGRDSELRELWEENEELFIPWVRQIKEIVIRLEPHLK